MNGLLRSYIHENAVMSKMKILWKNSYHTKFNENLNLPKQLMKSRFY